MSVDRSFCIRLITNYNSFSEIIQLLITNGYRFNKDSTVSSLSESDIDDFDFIIFDTFDVVRDVLDKREKNGLDNYIIIWEKDTDESLLVHAKKMKNTYQEYKNHYEIVFNIGIGVRIKGAERYTDFGKYINKVIPILVQNEMYVCEVTCRDIDC